MWNAVFGVIPDTIRNWVRDALNGIYGYYHFVDTLIRDSWYSLSVTLYWLYRNLSSFSRAVYVKLWQIARQTIPWIINEYRTLYNDAVRYAEGIYNTAAGWFNSALRYAENLVNGAINWVLANIWNPLWRDITTAWDWLTSKGETLWYYITHPDALATLIFDSLLTLLEQQAWAVADRLGKFFAALIIKNLTQFVTLVEDILNAIL
jgi:hypothetical protein